ncbi:alanine/glycine:cation symporter family protein [Leptolyngbya sp. 7M]|uniref:alanine/glycine:cation symporter family protein n=1 Tax=Leptolyngbya sp. 7M TaxID=2812896 RepID=UPI001B8D9CBD|nr:alanine/glycine:cation symporter family protein [Leptolyngbya sp. 7M]QYO65398.1 alanine:cation symporter family protein [Leptolyngbya sp. 7M]
MNHKASRYLFIVAASLLFPALTFAQEKGIDQRIDEAFKPVADAWESLVFYPAPFPAPFDLPIVLYLLIFGATFFTVAFAFVNIRRFPLALEVVRGKYDDIELAADPEHSEPHADMSAEVKITEEGDVARTIKDESQHGEVSHFQALATAVSGTVGLGNIAGVAIAVGIGGPGATFWMIVAGLLGMSSKFVECTLGVKYRDIDSDGTVHGGPMYYLSRGFAELKLAPVGKVLAVIFAIFCVGGSLGGGNAFQANQATTQITTMLGIGSGGAARTLIGIVMAILVAIVIIGGIKRIAKVTDKLVPLMAIVYILASLVIIFAHFTEIPAAIGMIISGAFTPEAGVGGVAGVIIQGFRRAAFSNEAGAGSAAIAHSAVKTKYPASEGLVALLEPFIDTVVICTMTAVVIVLFNMKGDFFMYGGEMLNGARSVVIEGQAVNGVDLTARAYNDVLPGFNIVLTLAIVMFAFSTMISWSYYGLQSWKYLFGRSAASDLTFKVLFCVFVVIGAAASLGSVLAFSDAMILAMVFPNMIGLLFLFPKVREELNRYLSAISKS